MLVTLGVFGFVLAVANSGLPRIIWGAFGLWFLFLGATLWATMDWSSRNSVP
jgi:hypothetical protein